MGSIRAGLVFQLKEAVGIDCITEREEGFLRRAIPANAPVSLEALHRFLMERGVAPYRFPDKLLVVRDIPRDTQGKILRDEILRSI